MTLPGKTSLITGALSGIGFAAAQLPQENGARVAIAGSNADKLEEARAELGGTAIAIRADITSATDLAALHDRLKEAFGTLDILFAKAGMSG